MATSKQVIKYINVPKSLAGCTSPLGRVSKEDQKKSNWCPLLKSKVGQLTMPEACKRHGWYLAPCSPPLEAYRVLSQALP